MALFSSMRFKFFLLLLCTACGCLQSNGSTCMAFVVVPSNAVAWSRKDTASTSCLFMGLYDTPLPPQRDNDKNNEDSEQNDNDDDMPETSSRLFEMMPDGTEKRGLLPRLSRSLTSGIGCYFETTDRKVVNLASKTNCHVEDAAWALEACKGDVTEAWTCISAARRGLLNQKVEMSIPENVDWDAELSDLMSSKDFTGKDDMMRPVDQEAFEKRKAERLQDEQKRNVRDFFKGGEKDQPWLPKDNPKPIDDEPWFTG